MGSKVCVPIDSDIYAEFILRTGRATDVASRIERIVENFLDRTAGDPDIWSDEHAEKFHAQLPESFEAIYGDPDGFCQWGEVRLWNGSQIRMKYKGKSHVAEVRNEELVFEGKAYTPSQLASQIADGTSRNAWRDLWVKERDKPQWLLADELRLRAKFKLEEI